LYWLKSCKIALYMMLCDRLRLLRLLPQVNERT
jgi:hypothetical protein